MFVENGYNKRLLKNLVIEYNNKKNNKSNHENNTGNRDYKNLKKLTWIPTISSKIKREFKKIEKHRGQHQRKIRIIWDCRIHERMPWTIRLAASENSTHSLCMYVRKIREALEINKLRTINDEDKTFSFEQRQWLLCHDEFLETSFHENGKPLNCNFYDENIMKLPL